MNRALQWKLIAGFILVFVAGGVTGGFFAAAHARHFLFASPHHGIVAERMRERLKRELNLTPDQVAKISPIVEKAGAELEDIRRYSGRRVHETFEQSHREISVYLTDQQRTKLQRMESLHRRGRGPFQARNHQMEDEAETPVSASPAQ